MAGPYRAFRMAKSSGDHEFEVDAIRNATVVFPPRHLVRVLIEVFAADPMMDAILSAAQAAEIALRLIAADSIVSHVFLTMVDPPRVIGRVEPLPSARFVGLDDGAGLDVSAYQLPHRALSRDH